MHCKTTRFYPIMNIVTNPIQFEMVTPRRSLKDIVCISMNVTRECNK